ncbi:hypothetical protein ASD44_01855 [Mesorhizobium sp. Root554]|nr:hypothetical protein ASD27_01860 [Mesorhizobium sp. Root1471]KQZ35469.1 hypothetical protein ASD44_01855 [Mesorhizobium sp. Root554]
MITGVETQWVAIRALFEGAALTPENLSEASGYKLATVRRVARQQGWRSGFAARLASGELPDQEARLRLLLDGAISRAEAAEREGRSDKTLIDAISAIMRTLEKIGEITRGESSAKENQIKRDADMADALRRIDERIVELARDYARQLDAAGSGAGESRASLR